MLYLTEHPLYGMDIFERQQGKQISPAATQPHMKTTGYREIRLAEYTETKLKGLMQERGSSKDFGIP